MKKYGLGIPDEAFVRGRVPMTKREIRILTIAEANIKDGDIVLDVGAGTGSLSCEAALQTPSGRVFALERKPEGIELIRQNAAKLEIDNIELIEAEAPAGMESLPPLDAVLIGGSGSHLAVILDNIDSLLHVNGKIVLNCITLQTLNQCLEYMKNNAKYAYNIVQVQVNRWEKVGGYDMAKAVNPIFIVSCIKLK